MNAQARWIAAAAAFLLLAFPARSFALSLSPSTETAGESFSYSGEAFGSRIKVGSTITSGASALASIGCSSAAPATTSNTAAGIVVPLLATTGTITDQVTTADDGLTRSTSGQSTIQSVNLLSGLITADALHTAGSTSWSGSSFGFTNTSTFTNLVVAGQSLSTTVDPNTKITLAGFGYVLLNQTSSKVTGVIGKQTINAIHVVVTQPNVLLIPVGTDVVIGHVQTSLAGPLAAVVGGTAYGTYAGIAKTVLSGTSFPAKAPCVEGTNVNTAAGITLPGLLGSAGTIENTATTTQDVGSSQVSTTSVVENVSLLGGFIGASVVTTTTQLTTDGVTPTLTHSGSIAGLVVDGNSIDVTGSTTITIPGLGKLYVHRVIQTDGLIEVRGLELLVNQPNLWGLAFGTSVRVAVARAFVL